MNQPPRNLSNTKAIDLAAEADFQVGELSVCPSAREVCVADRRITVEPRVLQVLVALARAEGAVVSRDQLIERCWGGRLVGDDAINSCVAKVRALAALTPEPAFDIETIPRVGYRMRRRERDAPATSVPESTAPPLPATSRRGIVWIVVPLAVAGIAAAALYLYVTRPREWAVTESHLSFIATPLVERWPSFSPDGTMMAYAAGPDIDSRRIYLRLLRGGDPIPLTHNDFDASSPVWSPDGSTIAYLLNTPGKPCRIMLVPVPSGTSRQVGACHASQRSSLSWDHDGRALFFADNASAEKPQRIYRLDLDSGQAAEFVHPSSKAVEDGQQSLSPDGRTLLLVRSTGPTTWQIVLHQLSDGAERLLVQRNGFGTSAVWSADSATVFVARTGVWDSSLWAYPISGAAPSRIMAAPAGLDTLASGPNGLLAMDLQSFGSELAAVPTSPGQAPQPLDINGLKIDSVDYAPDGTLVMSAGQSGAFALWLAEPGQHLHRLLPLKVDGAGDPRWSPDGTRFAYVEVSGEKFSVRVLTRSGAPVADIAISALAVGHPDWSADGGSILTPRRDTNGWRVWRTDLKHPDVSVPTSSYGWLLVRVHGAMMFGFKDGSSGIWRIDGTPRKVSDGPGVDAGESWTITNDSIVYPDFTDPDRPRLLSVPLNGGSPVVRGYPTGMRQNSFLAADPKSGRLVYALQTHLDADIGWIRVERK